MQRRQSRFSFVSSAAEVLEARALLSAVSLSGVTGTAAVQTTATPAVQTSLLNRLSSVTPVTATTVASNGDLNPYGAAFVPAGFASGGILKPGDLLVSNFNDNTPAGTGTQATGTTIVRITPNGQSTTFYQGPAGLGLTTALGVLKGGFVIVGNTPLAKSGTTVKQGSLLILDKNGHLVETLSDSKLLDGPWDLTINDQGGTAQVFVSNVLSGNVTRIDLKIPNNGGKPIVLSETQVASGYAVGLNSAALVLGPTGLAFDAKTDTLFVASTKDNAIYAIHNALTTNGQSGKGTLIFNNKNYLNGPLALVLAPNGDLITANGDALSPPQTNQPNPSELVEFTQQGKFVSEFQVDSTAAGGAFGIALQTINDKIRFAAVDDITNTVSVWTLNN